MTRICLGVITGAHGVRGLLRIKSFTAAPADIAAYGPLEDEAGTRRFEVTVKGETKGLVLAALAGVEDRDAAEALKGTRLYIERAALPPLEDEEEYYHADLIGLMAETRDGQGLGRVVAVHNFGAGDLLEIAPDEGPTLMLPFTKAAVPRVDLTAGRLVAEPPEDADE